MVSMEEVSDRVSRLEGAYEHLATKADIADLRGETKAAIASLETRLIRWTVTTMVAGMATTATIALVVASLAGG